MKNLITLFVFIIIAISGFSQEETKTNTIILGGSMNLLLQNNTYPLSSIGSISGLGGVYSNNLNDIKNRSFSFSPYIGKEINTKLLIGLSLELQFAKYDAEGTIFIGQPSVDRLTRNSKKLGGGIFARYTFNPESKIKFFIQPSINFFTLKEEQLNDEILTQEERVNFIDIGVDLGLFYDINSKVRITLRNGGLSYINGNWKIIDTDTEKNFSAFGSNLSLQRTFLGVEIRI